VLLHSFLSLGRFHVPVYGLFAAAGLMCAMTLSLYTARLAGIDPDALWNTGAVLVFTAFGLSRALLVVENLHTFLVYPVLVLELPSLTKEGVLLTAVVGVMYAWRKGLPLLRTLDAAAPCGALLWAFQGLGGLAEGTRNGMPAAVPWATLSSYGRVHPVEAYYALAGLLLAVGLVGVLKLDLRAGETAAWGALLYGLLLFVVDFFQLPIEPNGTSWFDGIQVRALEAMGVGGALLAGIAGRGAWIAARGGLEAGSRGAAGGEAGKDLGDAV
jgi:phosphatidylglycerol---prolipoprotein diacylglyceryl transferase